MIMMSIPQQNFNGTNNVKKNSVNVQDLNYNQNTINTTKTGNTQQINKQTISTNIFTTAASVGQRTSISINRYSRNFFLYSNNKWKTSLYSCLFQHPDTIDNNEDLLLHLQLYWTQNAVEIIVAKYDLANSTNQWNNKTCTKPQYGSPSLHGFQDQEVNNTLTVRNAQQQSCQLLINYSENKQMLDHQRQETLSTTPIENSTTIKKSANSMKILNKDEHEKEDTNGVLEEIKMLELEIDSDSKHDSDSYTDGENDVS